MEIIAIIVLALLVFWAIVIYNSLVRGRNVVEESWRQIDVQLKRRHDLIPNLVSSVKDYMQFERETLERVVDARSQATKAESKGDVIQAEGILDQAMGRLLAVFEDYPELKSQANVDRLMEELTATENRIGFARQAYNDVVLEQNNRVEVFPNTVFARAFNFKREEYFEIPEENAHEREVPNVSLS